jgi:hypothetical protein
MMAIRCFTQPGLGVSRHRLDYKHEYEACPQVPVATLNDCQPDTTRDVARYCGVAFKTGGVVGFSNSSFTVLAPAAVVFLGIEK